LGEYVIIVQCVHRRVVQGASIVP